MGVEDGGSNEVSGAVGGVQRSSFDVGPSRVDSPQLVGTGSRRANGHFEKIVEVVGTAPVCEKFETPALGRGTCFSSSRAVHWEHLFHSSCLPEPRQGKKRVKAFDIRV